MSVNWSCMIWDLWWKPSVENFKFLHLNDCLEEKKNTCRIAQTISASSVHRRGSSRRRGRIIFVCDQFAFNHLRACVCVCVGRGGGLKPRKCGASLDRCVCVYTSLSWCVWHSHQPPPIRPSNVAPGPQQQREGEPAAAVSCERWGLARRMFVLPAGKHWQKCAHARLTLASRRLHYIFLLPIHRIVLFTFPFQTWENTAACTHPANQSWSLAGRAGIDLLCLEDAAWFPLFFFFHSPVGRERLVLSPFLLRPNKSSRQPLTLWPMVPLINQTEGLAMNHGNWCL